MATTDTPEAAAGGCARPAARPTGRAAEDETALVEALIRGDEWVYADLVDRLYPAMLRLALGFVRDPDTANDVIQETWIAVVEGIDRFERRSSLRTWIFRILLNLARKRAAQDSRFLMLDEATDAGPALCPSGRSNGTAPSTWIPYVQRWGPQQDPEDWVLAREAMERIEVAIAELPPNQRAVITLRDVEGWTSKEVCDLLEISLENQRVLLHRARLAVREALRPYLSMMADGDAGPDLR